MSRFSCLLDFSLFLGSMLGTAGAAIAQGTHSTSLPSEARPSTWSLDTVSGEVLRLREVGMTRRDQPTTLILLATDRLKTMVLDLGPAKQSRSLRIHPGDHISIRGEIIDMGDYPLMKAAKVWKNGQLARIRRTKSDKLFEPDAYARYLRDPRIDGIADAYEYDSLFDDAVNPSRDLNPLTRNPPDTLRRPVNVDAYDDDRDVPGYWERNDALDADFLDPWRDDDRPFDADPYRFDSYLPFSPRYGTYPPGVIEFDPF
jgi:hypothetical protein